MPIVQTHWCDSTVGAESMARTESMARRRFAADTAASVHFLKDFFS